MPHHVAGHFSIENHGRNFFSFSLRQTKKWALRPLFAFRFLSARFSPWQKAKWQFTIFAKPFGKRAKGGQSLRVPVERARPKHPAKKHTLEVSWDRSLGETSKRPIGVSARDL